MLAMILNALGMEMCVSEIGVRSKDYGLKVSISYRLYAIGEKAGRKICRFFYFLVE